MKKKLLFLLPIFALALVGCDGTTETTDTGSSDDTTTSSVEEGPWNDDLVEGETAFSAVASLEENAWVTVRGTVAGTSGSSFSLYRNGEWLYVYNIQSSSTPDLIETGVPSGAYIELTAQKSSYSGSVQLTGYVDGAYSTGRKITVIQDEGQTIVPLEYASINDYEPAMAGAMVDITLMATEDCEFVVSTSRQDLEFGDLLNPAADFQVRLEQYHTEEVMQALIDAMPNFEKYHYYDFYVMATQTSSGWRAVIVDTSTVVESETDPYEPPAAETVNLYPVSTADSPIEITYGYTSKVSVDISPALAEQDLTITVQEGAPFTVSEVSNASVTITPTVNATSEVYTVKFAATSNPEVSATTYVKVLESTAVATDLPNGTYSVVVNKGNSAALGTEYTTEGVNVEYTILANTSSANYPTLVGAWTAGNRQNPGYDEIDVNKGAGVVFTAPDNAKITNIALDFYKFENIKVYDGTDTTTAIVGTDLPASSQGGSLNKNYALSGDNNVVTLLNDSTYSNSVFTFTLTVVVGDGQSTGGGGELPTLAGYNLVASYDFSSLTAKGTALDATSALQKISSCYVDGSNATGNPLTAIGSEIAKIYDGNGSGGAWENTAGLLKFGTGSANGVLPLVFNTNVDAVVINCHDWYTSSDQYPTNSNTVTVNSETPVLAPYNTTGAGEDVVFELAAGTTDITITSAYRIFAFEISVFAKA